MSDIVDSYLTCAGIGRSEVKVKGSRFLGEALPIGDEAQGERLVAEIRKRERDARHHCFAWRLGLPGPEPVRSRSSDDGEPSGTAGRPMLQLLEGRNLTNSIVVVTRYFGGTLLGTGGLLHAYSDAARQALDSSGVTEHLLVDRFTLELPFNYYNQWMQEMGRLGATVEKSQFTEVVTLEVSMRKSRSHLLLPAFTNTTQGRGTVRP